MIDSQEICPLPSQPPYQFSKINQVGETRLYWVDLAKSFGLFLVFWGHTLYGGSHVADVINRAIYSFHMPLFFILSGYVTKPDTNSFWQYVIKKFKRIILPSFILYVLTLPVFLWLFIDTSSITLYSFITRFFYIFGECFGDKPVWFFFSLYQIYILIKLLNLPNAKIGKMIIVLVFSLLFSFLFYISGVGYFKFFGFDKCVLGLFFYVFGMILRKTRYENYILRIGLILLPIWLITGVLLNAKVRMYDMHLGNFWFFIVSGITGSLCFFSFSKLFELFKNKLIVQNIMKYAKWTVFIVSSHYVLSFLFHFLFEKLQLLNTIYYDVVSLCFVIIALVLYFPICKCMEKHAPIII